MSARGKPKALIAIDWDARTLRVVHALSNKRGVTIDRLLSIPVPSDVDVNNPEGMGQLIKRVLAQEGIRTKHAIVDIPRDQAILKTLELPAASPEHLPGIVEIQIAKELPFPASDAVIDFAVRADAEDSETAEVLVAAVRHEVREQYEATLAVSGLKLGRIGLRPYANKVAVCRLLEYGMPERVLFVDVRPTLTEIDVIRNSALVFSRAASVMIAKEATRAPGLAIVGDRGSDEPSTQTEATTEELLKVVDEPRPAPGGEGVISSLVLEVTRSIEAYRSGDPGASVNHVVIGGGTGVEEQLAEAVQKRLGISTEIYNPASSFGWEPDEGAAASAFAAALGLVLGQTDDVSLHFDFLHPKKTVSVTQERLRKAPLVAASVAVFLVAAVAWAAQLTKADRAELAAIEAGIAELEEDRSRRKAFLETVEQIREFDEDQHVWVDVLYDILSVLPSNKELVVNHLEMNQKEGRVVLKTKALERDTATRAIRDLEAFRRNGAEKQRFEARMGSQAQKKGEKYPFIQDLRITIQDDGAESRRQVQRATVTKEEGPAEESE